MGRMSLDPSLRRSLAQAALKLAAERSWRAVTPFDLASAAGVDVSEIAPAVAADAADAVEAHFDALMAKGLTQVDTAATTRDRLFDLIMRRFEAMEPHRTAVLTLDAGGERDPTAIAAAHARAVRSARWVLALAGLDTEGMTGAARAQGLALILTQVRGEWRKEESADFVKTMAALDKALRRAEEMFGRLGGFEPKGE
jgi:hypothetical protein